MRVKAQNRTEKGSDPVHEIPCSWESSDDEEANDAVIQPDLTTNLHHFDRLTFSELGLPTTGLLRHLTQTSPSSVEPSSPSSFLRREARPSLDWRTSVQDPQALQQDSSSREASSM